MRESGALLAAHSALTAKADADHSPEGENKFGEIINE